MPADDTDVVFQAPPGGGTMNPTPTPAQMNQLARLRSFRAEIQGLLRVWTK